MTETVLVTGGTGYLAGWCLVELLRRGYRVRTTIRSPGREAAVRVAVGAEVDLGDRLTVAVADRTADAAGRRPSPAATTCCTWPPRLVAGMRRRTRTR